ncbi:ubiquitin-conjugating enzyme E2 D2B-like [Thrips palmi]|uniref:Ubiquitin-conjugating enzyme E2 D2B-like n=1 Tax=Thrips palmi TaxID=161013 RepID=A0A6P8ZVS1_THRPL|nr:ubiquitin-conjugating enzyme E2 D2B-like [Thrips palmi]
MGFHCELARCFWGDCISTMVKGRRCDRAKRKCYGGNPALEAERLALEASLKNAKVDLARAQARVNLLQGELDNFNPEDVLVEVTLDNDDVFKWRAVLEGPSDTPYENGKFHVTLTMSENYPFTPPKVEFKTRIFHCNINTNGHVCLNILKPRHEKDGAWKEALGVEQVLLSIRALLCEPNPDDPLMASVASLFIFNKPEHDRRARLWTQRFAM